MEKNLIVCLLFVASCISGFAQTDAKAKKWLDEVSAKYDAYKTIQSDFSFSVQQASAETQTEKGTLFLDKHKNQFHIVLPAQNIISDGKTTWSVLKEDQEVQVSEAADQGGSIGPTNLFTFYKKGFNYSSLADETQGQNRLHVIELTPIDTKTNYAKIKLRINSKQHIHDVQITDKSGAQYRYTIHTLYVNHQIPAKNFTFNASDYPNYEVVDLR